MIKRQMCHSFVVYTVLKTVYCKFENFLATLISQFLYFQIICERVLHNQVKQVHVSHWHANSSQLFCEFSHRPLARHSLECWENFHVS